MPPFGLYSVPRHHMYGGRTKSRTYNTNDFQSDQDAATASLPALPANKDGMPATQAAAPDAESKKKAAKKDKKQLVSLDGDKNAELERLLDRAKATADKEDVSKTKKKDKKQKKKHRRSEEDTHGAADASQVTAGQKGDKNSTGQERRAEKKRKRESEALAAAASAQLVNEEYLAGQQLAHPSVGALVAKSQSKTESQVVDQPSKKKTKRKSQSIQQNVVEHAQSAQVPGPDQPKMQKTKRKAETAVPGPSEVAAKHSLSKLPLPVPHDWIDGSDELKVKEHKKKQDTTGLVSSPVTPSPIPTRVAKQAPVPFPRLRTPTTKSAGTKAHKDKGEGLLRSNVLVPETPPPKTPVRTPVPFPRNVKARNDTVAAEYSPYKHHPQTGLVSSPTPNGDVPAPSTAPAALESSQTVPKLPSVPNALTDANLRSFKKPLTDGSKPRPRTKTGTSTVTSFPTSSASMSIVEAFARVGKPLVRSAAEKDPFITTDDKSRGPREGHEGIPPDIFSEKYREVTKIVNFYEEDQYLDEHLDWDAKHNQGQVPCLNKMTGCSAKKEELIRLSKDENMHILAQLDTPGDDLAKLDEANHQAQRAEDLLMLATRARIPVPIGCIEGKWTLYCPRYAETHSDRYGYGQRSLIISPIAGFKHKNTFTARMQLPPRTMAFSILAFQIPPHASFRTTTIKTASEGYTMDVVFLGNGFLHLRADLGRLLTGTTRKPHEDNHVMEFVGVHDEATQWWSDKKSEAEDEGRLMFAKHDGTTIGE
ncbi:hypothetical protein P171DRAFT_94181 [Karstenula rhodostoma CBS 690.94]|uniref:Uncharacterized protein n=1 Tax=Karstenula rhodostoma CBS 690.94 TaxID=1392251 RepID=A0A9P4U9Q1_9PLEO|nr:hypothetical protein P171DRAFT_94181 [Karstenula rhodostoma CBS 690.94]